MHSPMMEMRALMMILTKWLTVRMTRKTNCRRQQQECFHIKSLLLILLKSSFPFLVAEFSGLNDDPTKNPFEVLFYHSTEQLVHLNLCRRNRSLYVHYFFPFSHLPLREVPMYTNPVLYLDLWFILYSTQHLSLALLV
ncbi:uncharacterized protein LOC111485336 isoform X2 [Cucurbita maxima]|uniref:Uncharacterized protein LOC111485336 isoform X2 n=1 Tax=Cucurbita maxima TaxID=3661 RepID=A0A6J1JI66_CUCMA|nr:uncharacterized protein LOC111485336 isoform X2 [Cucurbita maxima]